MDSIFNMVARPKEALYLLQVPRIKLKESEETKKNYLENLCITPFKNSLDMFH